MKDLIDSVERNYTYVFNVCADAAPPAKDCEVRTSGSGPGPAFQVYNNGECRRLGKAKDVVKWSLLDEGNPTLGVRMTYQDGDQCELKDKDGKDFSRSMSIKFLCAGRFGEMPDAKVLEAVAAGGSVHGC